MELGRSCFTFKDFWSSSKIILGSTKKYFENAGKIQALFSGRKGALTTPTSAPRKDLRRCFISGYSKITEFIDIILGTKIPLSPISFILYTDNGKLFK